MHSGKIDPKKFFSCGPTPLDGGVGRLRTKIQALLLKLAILGCRRGDIYQELLPYDEVINEIDTTASWHGALAARKVSPIHLPWAPNRTP